MSKIRVGIIGQGRSGRNIHGATLERMTDLYEIVAVSDPTQERRDAAEKELGCRAYDDHGKMLEQEELDLIVNASPSHLHVPINMELLEKGYHVLCEKPLARTATEVDEMIKLAEEKGKVLAIFQQSRYVAAFTKIQEIIASGKIGRVVQADISFNGFSRRWDWQTLKENNGGNLLNTGPHPVDQALQLIGTDIMPDITCIMDRANTSGDAEDYVKLIMRSPGRPVLDVEISSTCAFPGQMYNIQGTNGGITGNTAHLDIKYFKPEDQPQPELVRGPLLDENGKPTYCKEDLKWYEESWDIPQEVKDLGMFFLTEKVYNMLHNTLTKGEPLEITPQQVRQQIAVMEECHRQNP